MSNTHHHISAIIISYNEATRIADCINSLKGIADEIIVVDNGSVDDTITIAASLGCIVFTQTWLGYGPQKNFAISKTKHVYILQIDCDERLDATLKQSVLHQKKQGLSGAYYFPFLHNYYGKFIRHGIQHPQKKLRLWNKEHFVWDDKQVHESLMLPTNYPTQKMQGFMLHYSYTSLQQHIDKSNRYSTEGANNLFKKGKKNYWWKIWLSPLFTFINAYIIRRGFLDGWHGYIIAKMEAYTVFLKYAKLLQLWKNEKN